MNSVCEICPRHCTLEEGQTGFCRARTKVHGVITCNNYGKVTSMALDPIEKKPFARFFSGSMILSVGSYGCNLRCPFCQNDSISMADENCRTIFVSPDLLIKKALDLKPVGNIGIAFTYNEPLVGYEYILDCAKLAHENNLLTALVTNATICREPLLKLLPFIDAMNIDLKGFTQESYDFVKGDLQSVKDAISLAVDKCHVEVTTLIVPSINDDEAQMEAEAIWLASINPKIPLHISRFFPHCKMQNTPATPVSTIYRLRDIAATHLEYVYSGNC